MKSEDKPHLVYVALGANLGDPVGQLVDVRRVLFAHSSVVAARSSSLYVSSPVGYNDQPDFINCVLELNVSEGYRRFFSMLQGLENKFGRSRDPNNQNAPRLIDIDLLLFGELTINEPDLVVPHPRMHERLFVLSPLKELNPTLADVHSGDEQDRFLGQKLHRLCL